MFLFKQVNDEYLFGWGRGGIFVFINSNVDMRWWVGLISWANSDPLIDWIRSLTAWSDVIRVFWGWVPWWAGHVCTWNVWVWQQHSPLVQGPALTANGGDALSVATAALTLYLLLNFHGCVELCISEAAKTEFHQITMVMHSVLQALFSTNWKVFILSHKLVEKLLHIFII
jgi:hypothetical protein